MVVYLTQSMGRLIGYINDVAVLIYNGEYRRELIDNASYKYFGPYTEAEARAIAGAVTDVERVIREKGRVLGSVTRYSRMWSAFIVPLNSRTAHGIMTLDFRHREVEFWVSIGFPSTVGQLPAVPLKGWQA
jgi:hypothetical protein